MKIHGLEHFTEALQNVKNDFVVIGGVASLLLHKEAGIETRATKDIDIVVVATEALPFAKAIREYVGHNKYQHISKSTGKNVYYRFEKPEGESCPKMLEIFSSKPDFVELFADQHIVPLTEASPDNDKLSAILLEDEYLDLIRANSAPIQGIFITNNSATIVLKARAYCDLSTRKDSGDTTVDSKDIKKHRADILSLTQTLTEEKSPLAGLPKQHMTEFIHSLKKTSPKELDGVLKDKKIRKTSTDIITQLEKHFEI